MSTETTEPGHSQEAHGARKTVTVTVQPGSPQPVRPETVTLTNDIYRVVWHCDGLPPDASLQIVFQEDPLGPFFLLESTGSEVIGRGNRGPAETLKRYTYEAGIQTGAGMAGMEAAGAGRLKNNATEPVPAVIDPEPREPPLTHSDPSESQ